LADLELHVLPLVEAAEAASVDPRVVHEDVVAAVVLGDETKAFSVLNHFTVPCVMRCAPKQVVDPAPCGVRPALATLPASF
jgi:hypothetical protein